MTRRILAPGQDLGTGATAGRVLRLVLPLPPREWEPNRHAHHMAKNRVGQKWREETRIVAAAEWDKQRPTHLSFRPVMPYARLSLRFVYCGRRRLDADSAQASFKPQLDGIVDAEVIPNDSPVYLEIAGVRVDRCPRGCSCGGRVEVVIEEISNSQ